MPRSRKSAGGKACRSASTGSAARRRRWTRTAWCAGRPGSASPPRWWRRCSRRISAMGAILATCTCWLDGTAALSFLLGDAEVDAIHAENLRAHRLGINGVPCFVIGGRHAIAGAQEPEVIERLLDVAIVEAGDI